MFFSAYIGNSDNLFLWREVMHQHGNWLGLVPYIESSYLDDGRNFSFGWLKPKAFNRSIYLQETKEYMIMSTSGDTANENDIEKIRQPWQRLVMDVHTNTIMFGISLRSGELRVVIPPCTPEQFYYTKNSGEYVFANDMRLMMKWAGLELDECAIYALFQYGAIPPTMTISKNVQRIPNGHVFKVLPNSDKPILEVFFKPAEDLKDERKPSNPELQVQETLDNILSRVPKSSILYFSGGVDSGLMASRLAELGRKDVILFNYSFGPQDEEGHLALKMAAYLGLECEQILYRPLDVSMVLERLGKDYSFPFGDISVIPANLLVHASMQSADGYIAVIEGYGAEGAYGLGIEYSKWKQLYSIPSMLRWFIAEGYKCLKLWRYNSGIERPGHAIRQSVQMSLRHSAVIAQNPLDGIAYTIPSDVRKNIEDIISTRVEVLGFGLGPEDQFILLNLVYVCAGEFMAKSFDPLRMHGVKPIYPFLEPPMLRLSFSLPWAEKCKNGEYKALLKSLLACSVPREMVYRPKSGFVSPLQEVLTYNSMQEFLRNVVMSRNNPLTEFYQVKTIRQMIERAQRGQPLSVGTYNFLWLITFTSGWLCQQKFYR